MSPGTYMQFQCMELTINAGAVVAVIVEFTTTHAISTYRH